MTKKLKTRTKSNYDILTKNPVRVTILAVTIKLVSG